eukprot:gene18691-32427_t
MAARRTVIMVLAAALSGLAAARGFVVRRTEACGTACAAVLEGGQREACVVACEFALGGGDPPPRECKDTDLQCLCFKGCEELPEGTPAAVAGQCEDDGYNFYGSTSTTTTTAAQLNEDASGTAESTIRDSNASEDATYAFSEVAVAAIAAVNAARINLADCIGAGTEDTEDAEDAEDAGEDNGGGRRARRSLVEKHSFGSRSLVGATQRVARRTEACGTACAAVPEGGQREACVVACEFALGGGDPPPRECEDTDLHTRTTLTASSTTSISSQVLPSEGDETPLGDGTTTGGSPETTTTTPEQDSCRVYRDALAAAEDAYATVEAGNGDTASAENMGRIVLVAVAGGGGALVVIVTILVCICCCRRGKKSGNGKPTRNRSTDIIDAYAPSEPVEYANPAFRRDNAPLDGSLTRKRPGKAADPGRRGSFEADC